MSDIEKRDSDSAHSDEKHIGDTKDEYARNGLAGIPDPDAGLSDEERAKLVSSHDSAWSRLAKAWEFLVLTRKHMK